MIPFDAHWVTYPEPVQKFLKEDRQWHRALRIKHAAGPVEVKFWSYVLAANSEIGHG
jgi:hypothetical protein